MERLHSAYPSADFDEEALNIGDEETISDDAVLETISSQAMAKLAAIAPPAVMAKISNASEVIECNNDSLKQDFGTACLKKSISASSQTIVTSPSPKSKKPGLAKSASAVDVTTTIKPVVINNNIETGGNSKSRYFSVKPMMQKKVVAVNGLKNNGNGFKSPGMQGKCTTFICYHINDNHQIIVFP